MTQQLAPTGGAWSRRCTRTRVVLGPETACSLYTEEEEKETKRKMQKRQSPKSEEKARNNESLEAD